MTQVFGLIPLLFLWSGPALRGAVSDCSIDLPVYDAYGTKLAFTVQSLMPVKARSTKDIPLKYFGTYGIGKSKSSIIFDKLWLGTDGFRVTLVGAKPGEQKRPIEIKVPLGECRYRQSTVVGNRDSGFDVSHTTAFGKVEGCKLEGDWWVRAVSIFGGGEYMPGFEGFVDRETGDIVIAGILRGNRHLVVLGRNKEPVRTIAVDFVAGQRNDLPTIRLSADCR